MIQIRIGNECGPRATFAEAVTMIQGEHAQPVSVVECYDEDVTITPITRAGRAITRKAGDPIFGMDVTVNPQRKGWGGDGILPAEVNWAGKGASSVEVTEAYVKLIALAAQIAAAANVSLKV